jgi:hypothetical protein
MRRVILDSSVAINVAKGKVSQSRWDDLCSLLRRRCAHFVCPLTFIELITGLGRGSEVYYKSNLEAANALLRPGDRFLKFPGHFVLDRVFGDSREKPDFEPKDFSEWASILLKATNKKQLQDGEVDLIELSRTLTFGFDFEVVIRSRTEGQAEHVNAYEEVRVSGKRQTPEDWANSFLKSLGIEMSDVNRSRLLSAINAQVTFASALNELALSSNYNFQKNKNDWVDGQRLYYLADRELYIITDDGPLRDKIRMSYQANRVVCVDEMLQLLG